MVELEYVLLKPGLYKKETKKLDFKELNKNLKLLAESFKVEKFLVEVNVKS